MWVLRHGNDAWLLDQAFYEWLQSSRPSPRSLAAPASRPEPAPVSGC
jgi:hypothetical protein